VRSIIMAAEGILCAIDIVIEREIFPDPNISVCFPATRL
jgi:hypothetical protein